MSREEYQEEMNYRRELQYQDRLERAQQARDRALRELERLKKAVRALYTAAYWHPDRPCDGEKLWTEVRDAAGIAPGTGTEIRS